MTNTTARKFIVRLVYCAATSMAAGCSGTSSSTPGAPATSVPTATSKPTATPSPKSTATPTATPTPVTPNPATTGQAIYVANSGNNSVTVYPKAVTGTIDEYPLATIVGSDTGLSTPFGIAVDGGGRIYVSNYANGSITVYASTPRGTLDERPLATIAGSATGLANPTGVAIDALGRIYVSNYFSKTGAGNVLVFAPNPSGVLDEAPIAMISGPHAGFDAPAAIALGPNGNVYVANLFSGETTEYAASPSGTSATSAPLATIYGASADTLGVAVDANERVFVTSNLIVENGDLPYTFDSLVIYPANLSGVAYSTGVGSIGELPLPAGVALDTNGTIYMVCGSEYSTSTSSGSPLTGGPNSVLVFAADPGLGVPATSAVGTVTGSATGLNAPYGIAIH
ncbi:MAG: NHL repeat-containing protein [Candidatus Eremiobacteraeota bacterium]|nr:NHL repeat-containing protein [Candidatus Eremiobacteraeota bacterium]